jgi:hypothetical protein
MPPLAKTMAIPFMIFEASQVLILVMIIERHLINQTCMNRIFAQPRGLRRLALRGTCTDRHEARTPRTFAKLKTACRNGSNERRGQSTVAACKFSQ